MSDWTMMPKAKRRWLYTPLLDVRCGLFRATLFMSQCLRGATLRWGDDCGIYLGRPEPDQRPVWQCHWNRSLVRSQPDYHLRSGRIGPLWVLWPKREQQ